MTKTATKQDISVTVEELRRQAEEIRNDETQTVGTVSVGDIIRQGDLYLCCVTGLNPEGYQIDNRQLVPGVSQGSRHILDGDAQVFRGEPEKLSALLAQANADLQVPAALIGPFFITGARCELTHPEHGHFVLPEGETFIAYHQRLFAVEIKRQQD